MDHQASQRQARPVAVLCQTRCGSQHLKALLGSHPQLAVLDQELFYPALTPDTFYGFWATRIGQEPARAIVPDAIEAEARAYVCALLDGAGCRWVGLDIKLHQLDAIPALWPAIRRTLGALGGAGIHLHRRNLLRSVVSERIMLERLAAGGGAVHRPDTPEPMRVRLDPAWTLAQLRQRARRDRRAAGLNAALGGATIAYESFEDPADAPGAIASLWRGLGLDAAGVAASSTLARQNPWPLGELVVNLDEIQRALAPTRFAWMADASS